MLAIVICGQSLKIGSISIDHANLIACLNFKYLTNKNDLSRRFAGGRY